MLSRRERESRGCAQHEKVAGKSVQLEEEQVLYEVTKTIRSSILVGGTRYYLWPELIS